MVVFVVKIIMVIILLHFFKGANSVSIVINRHKTTFLGETNVNISCSYTSNHFVSLVQLRARNKSTGNFDIIAFFYPPTINKSAELAPGGQYLSGRVSLTNPTMEGNTAVLMFQNIKCEDNNTYICDMQYITQGSQTATSNESSMIVTSPPNKPEGLSSSVLLSEVVQGQNVSFVCKGNVGNPPRQFNWIKHLADQTTVHYLNVSTDFVTSSENCSYYGKSNLTIALTATDNKATIQCEVQSHFDSGSLALRTQEINIYYDVRKLKISKQPDMETYTVGLTNSITLTCEAEGNPVPRFSWYMEPDVNTTIEYGNRLVLSDLHVNKSGTYVCYAYNNFSDVTFKEYEMVEIVIGEKKHSQASNKAETIRAIVGSACALILVIAVFIVTMHAYCSRKREPQQLLRNSEEPLSDINAGSAVQISPVYCTVKDSLKRSQETNSQVTVGPSEYAEVDLTQKTISFKAKKEVEVVDDNTSHTYAEVVKSSKITGGQ